MSFNRRSDIKETDLEIAQQILTVVTFLFTPWSPSSIDTHKQFTPPPPKKKKKKKKKRSEIGNTIDQ